MCVGMPSGTRLSDHSRRSYLVTVMLVVVELPATSHAVASIVCAPAEDFRVFQLYEYGAEVSVVFKTPSR